MKTLKKIGLLAIALSPASVFAAADASPISDLSADITTYSGAAFTVAGLVIAGLIGLALVKKFAAKAA